MTESDDSQQFPGDAYAPNGVLWWKLTQHIGKKLPYGAERKMAAWLAFNKNVGEMFTTKEARSAVGDAEPNDDEHFQRRLRALRSDGWTIASTKYDKTLPSEHYRVDVVGWYPSLGDRPKKGSRVSAPTRRRVFQRDGSRCQICGIGNGEPYPEGGPTAVLTVGHLLSANYRGNGDIGNLRVECAKCNEPLRSDLPKPESAEELLTAIRNLKKADIRQLAVWLDAGHKVRDAVDEVYDRVRTMAPNDRDQVRSEVFRIAPPAL